MSLGLRRLELLTITDPRNANLFGLPKKRIVFVTARVHPGESPSSYSTNLDFFVDIHAHSTLTNGFMYGNMHEDEERNERESLLPHLLSRCAEDFSLSQTDFNNHSIKAGTGRRAVGGMFGPRTLCYTLEVSFYSYTNSKGVTIPYTEDRLCYVNRAKYSMDDGSLRKDITKILNSLGALRSDAWNSLQSCHDVDLRLFADSGPPGPRSLFSSSLTWPLPVDCRLGRNLALTFYEYYQHQGLFGKRAHRRQLLTRSRSSSSGNLSGAAPDRHSDGEDQVLQEPFKLPPGIKRLEGISTPESDLPIQQLSRRDSDTLSLQETEMIFDDFSNCFEKAVSSDAKMCK
ncbi:Cytosolic carboxypeptidase 6 [Sparganum proliferum]